MSLGKYTIMAMCCIFSFSSGQDFAKTFLRISPDAVSRSVGGPNQAYSIGAVDLFINPALLSQHSRRELQFSNIIDLLSNQYASFAYSMPVSEFDHIGVGLVGRMNPGLQENGRSGVNIKNYRHYQYALIIGYARNLFRFSIGANLKYFRMGYDDGEFYRTASASGLDLGLHYIPSRTFRAGFIFQPPFAIKWDDNISEPAPGRMGLGVAFTPPYIRENFLQILLSVDRFADEPPQMNAGLILTPVMDKLGLKNLSLRSGLGNFDLDSQSRTMILDILSDSAPLLTVGAGLGIDTGADWGINLDYCFQIKEYITNQHIITTRISF